jgi:hypothetical protein
MNKLVKKIIDIYAQVGDFRITPYDGAIPVSEADAQAEKAVEDYTKAVIREERAKIVAWCRNVNIDWCRCDDAIEKGEYLEGEVK